MYKFSAKIRTVAAVILTAFIALLAIDANAGMNEYDSCRCKKGLATTGDYKHEVVEKCGQPALVQYSGYSDCREMWIFNFGPTEFMQGICLIETQK